MVDLQLLWEEGEAAIAASNHPKFEGNIHSLGGAFGFDAALNRAVAVDSRGLLESLRTVYGASALVGELQPKGRSGFIPP
ncbi:MAG: S46 family peptidase [Aphanocapsa lilacina HA4352-LM1]|jgi:hypothetical protein|nr:S46 family peptidase [Aphanocapsa lilacina HA4352-LM1]